MWVLLAALAFCQTLAVGGVLVRMARRWARLLNLIDRPDPTRKHHERPIPRSGGIAIYATFWGCLLFNVAVAYLIVPSLPFLPDALRTLGQNVELKFQQLAGLFLGASIIFLLGVLDDRFNLPPVVRLAVQVLACVPLIATGTVLKLFLPAEPAMVLTVIWVVLLTNSFNFLDNMNGLTSGVSVIVCAVMAVIALLAREYYMLMIFALLGGAVLAFWFFNFPKASIFLGDSGSTHLGYLFASLTILVTYYQEGVPTALPVLMPVIVLGVPLFDTLSVLLIRWRARRPLMQGDTNHISHRLVALGMSRTEAVLFLYIATLVVGLSAIPLRHLDWKHGILQAVVIFLIFFLLHWLERVSYHRRASG